MVDLKKKFQLLIDYLICLYKLIILKCNASIDYAYVAIELFIKNDVPLIIKHRLADIIYINNRS